MGKSRYEYQKEYREKNKDRIRLQVMDWYIKNNDYRRKYQREYYYKNKEEILNRKKQKRREKANDSSTSINRHDGKERAIDARNKETTGGTGT